MNVRILIADDHTLVREGIRRLLEELQNVEIVGEASDGREAVTMAEQLRPDIVMLDISMPELNGLDAAARIRRDLPSVKVIMLSMMANEELVAQALNAGAAGYLLKDAEAVELGLAVKAAMHGDTYLSPAVASHAAALARQGTKGGEDLTSRQREVLQLIAEGNTTKEIAHKLSLSVRTVETYRGQIMDRLGIRDLAGLVRYAIRIGLVSPDP